MSRHIEIWRNGADVDYRWSIDLYADDDLTAMTYRHMQPDWHYDARFGEWCVCLADPYGAYWAEELYVDGVRQEEGQ